MKDHTFLLRLVQIYKVECFLQLAKVETLVHDPAAVKKQKKNFNPYILIFTHMKINQRLKE